MAAKKNSDKKEITTVNLFEEGSLKPRLKTLKIRNFRSIGSDPVTLELNDIVVLVGPNNTGKSSILRAYQIVMSHGSKEGQLEIDDFPQKTIPLIEIDGKQVVDEDRLPQIELETIVYTKPGDQWQIDIDGEVVIRERWIWNQPKTEPKRQGFDAIENDWSDNVPWGAPNIANSYRPKPYRIGAFDSPADQENQIKALIVRMLDAKLSQFKSTKGVEYTELVNKLSELKREIFDDASTDVEVVASRLSSLLSLVFPNYGVELKPSIQALDIEKQLKYDKDQLSIQIGNKNGFMSSFANQGSGAKRTFMWVALRLIKDIELEQSDKNNYRPHVLLLDEPELCLHPSAVREAAKVLYDLGKTPSWQVVLTTHSPAFINLAEDNTTIARLETLPDGTVSGKTIYRPTKSKLSHDEKEELKMLNLVDPALNEFFFGGKNIIVEGDTEYTAFRFVQEKYPDKFKDVNFIRARGKGIIKLLCKILNQFGSPYTVLHDSDLEDKSNVWGMNKNILNESSNSDFRIRSRVIASKVDFEKALLNKTEKTGKPYAIYKELSENQSSVNRVIALLEFLLDGTKPCPKGFIEWKSEEELRDFLK